MQLNAIGPSTTPFSGIIPYWSLGSLQSTQEWNWRPREYDQPFFDGEPGALEIEPDTVSG